MTNNKLLLPLTVAASLAIGAASYHFGADYVSEFFQDENVEVKLEKASDKQVADTQSKVQLKIPEQPVPKDVLSLVSQLETLSNAYFTKEQQIERIYDKTIQALDSFSKDQLGNLEKQVMYRAAIPMSSEALARKKYDNVVGMLSEFSQEALVSLNKEIVGKFAPVTYNSAIGAQCLSICREKLDGGFGSTYSTK
tara:strand:+ start:14802 stop:15386 length:585 start_codon:yes stop_codon:yes gene_type:complete